MNNPQNDRHTNQTQISSPTDPNEREASSSADKNPDVQLDQQLSRKMTYILGQGLLKEGLSCDSDGFVNVDQMLSLRIFTRFKPHDVERVVFTDPTSSFQMRKHPDTGQLQVKTVKGPSGHSSGPSGGIHTLSGPAKERILRDLYSLVSTDYTRHNLTQAPGGFLDLHQLTSLSAFSQFRPNDLAHLAKEDPNQRFTVQGDRIALKHRPSAQQHRREDTNDVQLSKKMAYFLRHGAEKEGVAYETGGFVDLAQMLNTRLFSRFRVSDIERVVEQDPKGRYQLREDPGTGRLLVRATQGHSVEVPELGLRLVTDPAEFPTVIHGTYLRKWESIKKTGLNRMNRMYIHFAVGEVGDAGVISGMRASAQVLIYIDLPSAMKDGVQFYVSDNNVVLCRGDEKGTLPTRYFKHVYQRVPRQLLDFQKQ